ncbi:PREDICTED: cytochrome P450 4C1-like [Nicrophorus vespilloides]|uniref:Cytochrome P450 4C1-like n=1 Tax=Nicrophorus vespilloides TaxID=110193 RepID=A0ABM1MF24_NICVS|nr:PREDICTED: cytochrome P450 4C1-like [Nicrophorus vespilloides]XP_017773175.1 PREDICTED: cytochrome P450 4C1-like [Nicrophorus vespilloides]XP_017773176.1 PREDICTED: cytochrome P450 4C1-like [Nicrophorus vespilloides]
MLFTYLLIIAIIIASTGWILLGRKKNVTVFPGPKPFPVIGNILEFIKRSEIIPKCVNFMVEFGDIYKLQLGPTLMIIVCDPNLIEKLLTTQQFNAKSQMYDFLRNWLGMGLLTSSGEKWQRHRKIITPSFHFQILEKFVVTFDRKSLILVEKLKKHSNQADFDISPYIYNCTLDIICETAMGISMNIQEDSTSAYVKATNIMSNTILNRVLSPLKQFDVLYRYTSDYLLEMKCLNTLHTTTENVIHKRKAIIGENVDSLEGNKVAFLDMLFNKGLSFNDIKNEVDTFMFEGHDTTGVALSFIVYCLSKNPDIQDKVFEEQQQIYENDPNIDLTYNILQSMNYLEKVIKEAMRLYPSVPFFGRAVCKDFEYNDFIIKKGSSANIFAFGLHRNPKYFPDPEKFDPDRFSPENCRKRPPYVYIPFSAGSRNCIGQKFAMLEMKTTISRLIWNYKFLPCPGFKPDLVPAIILKSLNGVRVKLVNRE